MEGTKNARNLSNGAPVCAFQRCSGIVKTCGKSIIEGGWCAACDQGFRYGKASMDVLKAVKNVRIEFCKRMKKYFQSRQTYSQWSHGQILWISKDHGKSEAQNCLQMVIKTYPQIGHHHLGSSECQKHQAPCMVQNNRKKLGAKKYKFRKQRTR